MVNKKIQEEEQQLFQLYNRFPLVLDHGEGVYLYDTDGKKYLDFAAGIAVMSLGYQNKELEESLTEQIKNCAIHPICFIMRTAERQRKH